ncbi:MAG: ACT domain-containing protein [Pontiellaceae bacterium]|nr:ACT domain-containing protein [Pontiellaceae bacterium]
MKLKQLSVFLENKPGRLRELCALLADNNIDIITISLADTEQFGILRLIVSDSEAAKKILDAAGFVAKITEVIAVEVMDKPGGLRDVLQVEEAAGISVEYMYAFTIKSGENAILLFRFDDMDKAVDALKEGHFNVLEAAEIRQRIANR